MTILILTYHAVEVGSPPLFTAPDTLSAHISALAAAGYQSLTLAALAAGMRESKLPERAVVFTFDDGYESVYQNALPRLNDAGFTATIFIISGQRDNRWQGQPSTVPTRSLVTWEQMGRLAEAGWELGAHTHTHPVLTTLTPEAVESEVSQTKDEIGRYCGVTPTSFCYPYGALNPHVREVVTRHYTAAAGTRMSFVDSGADLYDLPRVDSYYVSPALLSTLERPQTRLYFTARRVLRTVRRVVKSDWQPT